MPNYSSRFQNKYDEYAVLDIIAVYLLQQGEEKITSQSFQKTYSEIIAANPNINMPSYDMARLYIKNILRDSELTDEHSGVTRHNIWKLTELYVEDLHYYVNRYQMQVINDSVIPCIVPLPDSDTLKKMVEAIAKVNGKTPLKSRKQLIQSIRYFLKNKYKDVVLAVIPEANPLALSDDISEKYNSFLYCQNLLMFVKNTEEGKKLIKELEDFSNY